MSDNKLENTLIENFNKLPKWLKNITVIFIIIGVTYFGFFHSFIYKNNYYNTIETLQEEVVKLQLKVNKMETQQLVNAQMMNEIITLKNVSAQQTDYQIKQSEILHSELEYTRDEKDLKKLKDYDSTYQKEIQDILEKNMKDKINLTN